MTAPAEPTACPGPASPSAPLREEFDETGDPGVYAVSLVKLGDEREERLYAYNVPADEGDLALAGDDEIRKRAGEVRVEIQSAGNLHWIQGKEAGNEVRKLLLAALAAILMMEQLLACRLSYHPKPISA